MLWRTIGPLLCFCLLAVPFACQGTVEVGEDGRESTSSGSASSTGSTAPTSPPESCVTVCVAFAGCLSDTEDNCVAKCSHRQSECADEHDKFLRCAVENGNPDACEIPLECSPLDYVNCAGDNGGEAGCSDPFGACSDCYMTVLGRRLRRQCTGEQCQLCECSIDGSNIGECAHIGGSHLQSCCARLGGIIAFLPND